MHPTLAGVWLLSFVGVTLALASIFLWVPGTSSSYRFAQYTNLLLLWPAWVALERGNYFIYVVFGWAYAASVLHHGCDLVLHVHGHTHGVHPNETYALVAVGVALLAVPWVYHVSTTAKVARRALTVLAAAGALGLEVAVIVWLFVVAHTRDGCAGGTARMYSGFDYFTALSVLVVVSAYLIQLRRAGGHFYAVVWFVAMLALLLAAAVDAHSLTHSHALACLAVVGLLILLAWGIAVGSVFSAKQQNRWVSACNAWDVAAALAFAALALFVFFHFDRDLDAHGWWHVLASAGASLALLAIHASADRGASRGL